MEDDIEYKSLLQEWLENERERVRGAEEPWWQLALGAGFARVDAALGRFQMKGGDGVSVKGRWPNYVVHAEPFREHITRRTAYNRYAFQPEFHATNNQPDGIMLVPGHLSGSGSDILPTMGGVSLFSTTRPYLPIQAAGGMICLKREFTVTASPQGNDDNGVPYSSLVATWTNDDIEIVQLPLGPNPTANTPLLVQAKWTTINGGDMAWAVQSVSPGGGYLHRLLCAYNSNMEFLYMLTGGFTNSFTDPTPTDPRRFSGTLVTDFARATPAPPLEISFLWDIAYAG